MKKCILSALAGAAAMFVLLAVITNCQTAKTPQQEEYQHIDYVSNITEVECYVCGESGDTTASAYWGEDNIGLINLNNFDLLYLEINRYGDGRKLIKEPAGVMLSCGLMDKETDTYALVAALQTHSAPVQKITIVPRTSGALGYTMQVEQGNHYLMTKEEIENKIATYAGGRAAEEVALGSVSTGASNDIEQATKLARAMITRYGMSDEFDMVALETVTNQYLGGDASLACSAETQTKVDQLVVELVKKQHNKARQLLIDNREKLQELSLYLYEKETITGEEFMHILNA